MKKQTAEEKMKSILEAARSNKKQNTLAENFTADDLKHLKSLDFFGRNKKVTSK